MQTAIYAEHKCGSRGSYGPARDHRCAPPAFILQSKFTSTYLQCCPAILCFQYRLAHHTPARWQQVYIRNHDQILTSTPLSFLRQAHDCMYALMNALAQFRQVSFQHLKQPVWLVGIPRYPQHCCLDSAWNTHAVVNFSLQQSAGK